MKKIIIIILSFLVSFNLIYGSDSSANPVTAVYCDNSTLDIYPFSFVTRTDGSTFNCYDAQVTPIRDGFRYGFEDSSDADYNDIIIDLWVTGNNTGSPIAHVKFVSKDASYKHWIYLVYNGTQQLVFKAENASYGSVFDFPLPVKSCGDFDITVTPGSRSVLQGESADFTVKVNAVNGFAGNVNLTATGLPDGTTANFNPSEVQAGNQSILTLTTAATTPTGTYTVTITGTSGELTHSTTLNLTVNEPFPNPDFTITAEPSMRTLEQGESAEYTINVNALNDFSGKVNVTASGLPDGTTANFSPSEVQAGNQSILTLTTAATTPAGTYTVTITGTSGELSHSTTLSLTVNEPSVNPDFTITAEPSMQTLEQGETTNYTISVNALNGFAEQVRLVIPRLPEGITINFQPAKIFPDNQSILTIFTSPITPTGTYNLNVTGTAGEITRSVWIKLKVNERSLEPDFNIVVDPLSRTLFQGQSTDYKITLSPLDGFSEEVGFSLKGLPTGVKAIFQPEKIQAEGQSTLTISTTEKAAVGSYSLILTAKSPTSGLSHDVTITLEIEEKPLEPDFNLTATPVNRTVKRGDSAEYTIKVNALNGFSEEVALTAFHLPTGTEARFTPDAVNPDTQASLVVSTSAQTPIGSHTFTVSGKAGELEHTITLTLTLACPDFTVEVKANPGNGPAPLTVLLEPKITSEADFPVSTYTFLWDFGDNTASELQKPQHVFQAPGIYTVSLTVTNPCGKTRTASTTVTVEGFEGTLVKSFSTGEAVPGDTVFITIEARNDTRFDFNRIIIEDELSPYLQYIEDDAPVTPRRSGQEMEWQFPGLNTGETLTFKIKVKILDTAPAGLITNTAYLSHDSLGAGKRIASNTASLNVNTIDVTLLKQVEQTVAGPGDIVKYQLTVKNNSTTALPGITLTDELSSYLEFVSQTGGLEFSRQGRTLQWKGTVEAGQQAVIIFKGQISSTVLSGTRIENTARLQAPQLKEPVTSDTVVVTVASEPIPTSKVQFTLHSEVPQTEVGRVIRFSVTTVNMSGSALLSPVIEVNLPQGFNYVANSVLLNNQLFSEPQGSRRMMWQLPVINAHETVVLRYQVVIGADAARGRNISRAVLRAVDTGGQDLFYESSAFVNVSASGFIFYCGLEGTVFLDRDHDEFYTLSDTPLEGIEVRMSSGEKALTDSTGHYSFDNLFPGEYAVGLNSATLPEKYRGVSPVPQVVVLSDGLTDTADFAVKFKGDDEETGARLEGRVFFDKNRNRLYDDDDPLCEIFKVKLDDRTVTIGRNGTFVFTHLELGTHTIEILYNEETKSVKEELTVNIGSNNIDIPLKFSGIKIIIKGEEQ
jgi:uncharacterized repeat protein (TIGR01451 family)